MTKITENNILCLGAGHMHFCAFHALIYFLVVFTASAQRLDFKRLVVCFAAAYYLLLIAHAACTVVDCFKFIFLSHCLQVISHANMFSSRQKHLLSIIISVIGFHFCFFHIRKQKRFEFCSYNNIFFK